MLRDKSTIIRVKEWNKKASDIKGATYSHAEAAFPRRVDVGVRCNGRIIEKTLGGSRNFGPLLLGDGALVKGGRASSNEC